MSPPPRAPHVVPKRSPGAFSISTGSRSFRTAQAAPTPQAESKDVGSAPLADPSSLRVPRARVRRSEIDSPLLRSHLVIRAALNFNREVSEVRDGVGHPGVIEFLDPTPKKSLSCIPRPSSSLCGTRASPPKLRHAAFFAHPQLSCDTIDSSRRLVHVA